MKIASSFLFILVSFISIQFLSADQSDSSSPQKKRVPNPFKTALKHKKKFIEATVITVVSLLIAPFKTANAFATFTQDSWLIVPNQKRSLVERYKEYLICWIIVESSNGPRTYFKTQDYWPKNVL
jgi:hypothetical protein